MCNDDVMCSHHEDLLLYKKSSFPLISSSFTVKRKLLISSNKMKTILFLSFFILFVDVTFSTPSETAENIDTAFQAVDDDDNTGKSDLENTLDADDDGGVEKNDKNTNAQDVRIKLTPGKDIILTITPDGTSGGVTYTRWGKKTCRQGAELVYEGISGGGHYTQKGNGANYICLPKDPQYLSTAAPSWQSYLYGAEYETNNKIFGTTTHDRYAPCVVCYVPNKSTKLMIPAKTSCPTSWTKEYHGYLMTEHHSHNRNSVYECVDYYPDIIDGSARNNGARFYFIEAVCNHGLPCSPYVARRAITCVMCTR